MNLSQALARVGSSLVGTAWRYRRVMVQIAVVLALWWLDRWLLKSWTFTTTVSGWSQVFDLGVESSGTVRTGVALTLLTAFLAFVNLYMKISIQAPKIQRRLRPAVFFNIPFAIYLGMYLLLSTLAYFFFFRTIGGNWFLPVAAASLLGIGVGNADVKFGGFSLLPLAEFLQSLEAVVQAGIGVDLNELDIANRASLRDRLAAIVSTDALERECRLLGAGGDAAERDAMEKKVEGFRALAAGDTLTYNGLLAGEIVARSEANARRLIDLFARRPAG